MFCKYEAFPPIYFLLTSFSQSLKCSVNFLPHGCVFQDLTTGKMIGAAKSLKRLYYLQRSRELPTGDHSSLTHSSMLTSTHSDVWLQHFRLVHPPFTLLKTMFPNIFKGVDVNSFHYDVFESYLNTNEFLVLLVINFPYFLSP